MKYDFQCQKCDHTWEVTMSPLDFKEAKATGIPCDQCDGQGFNVFNPQAVQVSYKGFQWADKNYKEKAYRAKRSSQMAAKQSEVHKVAKLIPNYKGEETGSWKEAKMAAEADGKFSVTYDRLAAKERS